MVADVSSSPGGWVSSQGAFPWAAGDLVLPVSCFPGLFLDKPFLDSCRLQPSVDSQILWMLNVNHQVLPEGCYLKFFNKPYFGSCCFSCLIVIVYYTNCNQSRSGTWKKIFKVEEYKRWSIKQSCKHGHSDVLFLVFSCAIWINTLHIDYCVCLRIGDIIRVNCPGYCPDYYKDLNGVAI